MIIPELTELEKNFVRVYNNDMERGKEKKNE